MNMTLYYVASSTESSVLSYTSGRLNEVFLIFRVSLFLSFLLFDNFFSATFDLFVSGERELGRYEAVVIASRTMKQMAVAFAIRRKMMTGGMGS